MNQLPVLVVGGGAVAEQKVNGLLAAGARISVIAPSLSPVLVNLAEEQKITLYRRRFERGDVKGFFLVIGATDNPTVQREIFSDAHNENIPVNIVDVPELCTFYLSSVFQEGDLKIAVSTNGKSPTLGKIIRDRIQSEFAEGYPELLETLGEMRPDVFKVCPDFPTRKVLFERFVSTELDRLELYRRREVGQVHDLPGGKVFIVGSGPGDPELITVKGLRILRAAEVILYDSLINTELLTHAPPSAERIHVGKKGGVHCMRQGDINDLLIRKARGGKKVVRLKGGDPFIFGRGGEELEALQEAGIAVEVVPGITAGIGVPTSLGVPLTHRRHASSVVFVTGHEDPTKKEEQIDWHSIARCDTIVIYMGVKRLPFIVDQLLQHGVLPLKPVSVIFGGTLPEEIVVKGTLRDIEQKVDGNTVDSPGLIIVGDVVRFLDSQTLRQNTGELLVSNHESHNT